MRDHKKLWKLLKIWDYQTTLPASWETCMTVKKQQLEPDMEKRTGLISLRPKGLTRVFSNTTVQKHQLFGKGVRQSSILSPCSFNLYAEYIMWNARLDEASVGIKIAWRNINNLRYADDTTLTAESKKELKSLWIKVKEERESERAGLKLNIQKTKIMASGSIT